MGISGAIAAALTDVGVGAATAGTIASVAAPALVGAAGGATLSGVTGGNPLTGALTGGLTGGFAGIGGDVLGSTIGNVGAEALGGAAGGALGAGITGGNPLTSAALGGVAGGVQGYLSGTSASAGGPTAGAGGAGGTTGAAGTAAPTGVTPGVGAVGPDTAGAGGAGGLSAGGGAVVPAGASSSLTGPSGAVSGAIPASAVTGATTLPASAADTGSSFLSNLNPSNWFGPPVNQTVTGAGEPFSTVGTAAPGASTVTQLAPASVANTVNPTTGLVDFATGAGGAGAATGPTSVESLFQNPSLANLGNVIAKNPGIALGAAGLGLETIMQPSIPSISGTTQQLQSEAAALGSQSAALESYLQTGTLPTGVQASLNQAAESAKAAIRSQYARMGDSGSSAEAQDLANVDQTVAAQGGSLALQLLQQGVSEGNLSAQLYQTILNTATAENAQLSQAIGNFAGSLAGGGTTIRLAAP